MATSAGRGRSRGSLSHRICCGISRSVGAFKGGTTCPKQGVISDRGSEFCVGAVRTRPNRTGRSATSFNHTVLRREQWGGRTERGQGVAWVGAKSPLTCWMLMPSTLDIFFIFFMRSCSDTILTLGLLRARSFGSRTKISPLVQRVLKASLFFRGQEKYFFEARGRFFSCYVLFGFVHSVGRGVRVVSSAWMCSVRCSGIPDALQSSKRTATQPALFSGTGLARRLFLVLVREQDVAEGRAASYSVLLCAKPGRSKQKTRGR